MTSRSILAIARSCRAALIRMCISGGTVVRSMARRTGGVGGEGKMMHRPVARHAHGPERVGRAVPAGCTSIEHGALIGPPKIALMAEHGTYFDPNTDPVFRNYFENKSHYLGIGNYTEEGFAQMKLAVPKALHVFQLGLATPRMKMVFGTDAVAGSHGRNFQELEYRVITGGQKAMDAITSATSLAAESLGLGDRVGRSAPGYGAGLRGVGGERVRGSRAVWEV